MDPPDVRLAECRPPRRDLVDVTPLDRIVARVEPVRRSGHRPDVDVCGKFVVDLSAEELGREVRVDVEMGDLRQGVYARIGASRSIQFELAPFGSLDHCALDLAGDRTGVFLDLPAAVFRARVFDQQFEACHIVRRQTPAGAPSSMIGIPVTRGAGAV